MFQIINIVEQYMAYNLLCDTNIYIYFDVFISFISFLEYLFYKIFNHIVIFYIHLYKKINLWSSYNSECDISIFLINNTIFKIPNLY